MTGRESGLRHGSSDGAYAAAIMLCTAGDPSWCSAHGRCRMEGACFAKPEPTPIDRIENLENEVTRLKHEVADLRRPR